jgi:predicted transcriptional regulator
MGTNLETRKLLLSLIEGAELYTRQIAHRIDKGERTVAQMLSAMELDGLVTSRVRTEGRYNHVSQVRLWKATGKSMPDSPTPTLNRKTRSTRARKRAFTFAALLRVMK